MVLVEAAPGQGETLAAATSGTPWRFEVDKATGSVDTTAFANFSRALLVAGSQGGGRWGMRGGLQQEGTAISACGSVFSSPQLRFLAQTRPPQAWLSSRWTTASSGSPSTPSTGIRSVGRCVRGQWIQLTDCRSQAADTL